MHRSPHLYIVEDDAALREMLSTYFGQYGMRVTEMDSAEALLERLASTMPDLILMDVSLPGLSGLEACQRLRQRGMPVSIILMSARNEEVDRIVGLEMGADDYVAKPFSTRELLARIRAVLRRGPPTATATEARAAVEVPIRIGEWTFRPASRSLHRREGVRMLNTVEYALLAELTAVPGQPVTRERLLEVSHVGKDTALLRAVDAAIMRLRRLLEADPANPRYIQTVRFHGYVFVPQQAEALA